jgi:hypothetical protein
MSAFRVRHVESVVLWLWITPLGFPVVPDVNAIRMTSFAPWPAPGGGTAAQDVVDLAAPKIRPDLVRDRAQTLQGEEDIRELHPVRQLDRDDVSRADAERRESRRHPVDSRLELGIADAASTVDDRDPIGMRRGSGGQDRVERLGAPVPRLLIARDEIVREPGRELHGDASSLFIIRRGRRP